MSITFRAHLSLVAAAMLAAFGGRYAAAAVVDFEDLALPPSGFFNGDPGNLSPGDSVSQPWTSGGASFANTFGIDVDFAFPYWSGFAYSDVVNTTTNTFDNQYAAYPGSGFQSTTYAIAYSGAAAVSLPSPATVSGFRIANTTYAYLTMQDGDIYGFTQPLAAEGWFLVTASGSLGGTPTGSAVFYLADLRGPSPPGLVAGWEWFDLAGLGTVDAVSFAFSGSDVGSFGLNTPAYFAMDNFTYSASVPEPSTWAILVAGVGGAAAATGVWRRRR